MIIIIQLVSHLATTASTSPPASSPTTPSVTSSTEASPSDIYLMPCICYENKTFTGMTEEEIIEMLIKETEIDTKSTSSAKNKLRSKGDNRPTSKTIGYAGMGFIVLIIGTVALSDGLIALLKLREKIAA